MTVQPFTFPTTGQEVRTVLTEDAEPAIKGLESHLYVVEFGQYGIKVGITVNPADRLGEHQRAGRAFGRPATRGWLTPPHIEARGNERKLIAFCAQQAGADPRGEYFAVPFETAFAFASQLPRSRGDRAAYEADCRARLNVLKQALGFADQGDASGLPGPSAGALRLGARIRIDDPDASPNHGRAGVLLDAGPDWRIVQLDGESDRWLLGAYMVVSERALPARDVAR